MFFKKEVLISIFSIGIIFVGAFASQKILKNYKKENINLNNSFNTIISNKTEEIHKKEEIILKQQQNITILKNENTIINSKLKYLKTKKEELMKISTEITTKFLNIWSKYMVKDEYNNYLFGKWNEQYKTWDEKYSSNINKNPIASKNSVKFFWKKSDKLAIKLFEIKRKQNNLNNISNSNLLLPKGVNNKIDLLLFVDENSWKKPITSTNLTNHWIYQKYFGYEISFKNFLNEVIKIAIYGDSWSYLNIEKEIKKLGEMCKEHNVIWKSYYDELKNIEKEHQETWSDYLLAKEFDNFSDKYIEKFNNQWYEQY